MTRITSECCGYGQDQLAYSLEFTALQPLIDSAMVRVAASGTSVVVVPDSTVWLFDAPPPGWTIGAREGRNRIRLRSLGEPDITNQSVRPDSAWYLAVPNGDNHRAMRRLSSLYDFKDGRRYERDGYAISSYRMVLRRPES